MYMRKRFCELIKNERKSTLQPLKSVLTMATRNGSFLNDSPNRSLNRGVLERYRYLPRKNNNYIQATYLWIDGTGEHLRLKDRVLDRPAKCVEDLPNWQFDGSSTYFGKGKNSDITLFPRSIYRDPFKKGKHDIIVLCDTYDYQAKPTKTNLRCECEITMDEVEDHEPWFGIEQEYTLLDVDGRPFGWPRHGFPGAQGPYYCAVGAHVVFARDLVEAHTCACLYSGIDFAGTNSEVTPAQWEYQIGPSLGIKACDDLWVSRYILTRIAEEFGLRVTFDPKPVKGWNGAGAHVNFSTKSTRSDGGIKIIEKAIEKLEKTHSKHIAKYDPHGGMDNQRRLIGELETSSIEKFSSGIADRDVSVRIPRRVSVDGKGHLEDRRPAANCDPYAVCRLLVETCILDK